MKGQNNYLQKECWVINAELSMLSEGKIVIPNIPVTGGLESATQFGVTFNYLKNN